MAALGKLRTLETLALDGSLIEDEWLASLDSLPLVKQLSLRETPFMGPACRRCENSGNCGPCSWPAARSTTWRSSTSVRLKRLDKLDLSRTYVTDQGVAELQKLSSLRHLELQQTAVTPQGVQSLQATFPGRRGRDELNPLA